VLREGERFTTGENYFRAGVGDCAFLTNEKEKGEKKDKKYMDSKEREI